MSSTSTLTTNFVLNDELETHFQVIKNKVANANNSFGNNIEHIPGAKWGW